MIIEIQGDACIKDEPFYPSTLRVAAGPRSTVGRTADS